MTFPSSSSNSKILSQNFEQWGMIDIFNFMSTINDFDDLVGHLKSNQKQYIIDGIYLNYIKEHKLYLKEYKSFRHFCRLGLQRSPYTIKLNIIAANVCLQLRSLGYTELPHNISQANAVFSAVNEEISIGEVWQRCLDTYKLCELTTSKIDALFKVPTDFIEPEYKFLRIPYPLYQKNRNAGTTTERKYHYIYRQSITKTQINKE